MPVAVDPDFMGVVEAAYSATVSKLEDEQVQADIEGDPDEYEAASGIPTFVIG